MLVELVIFLVTFVIAYFLYSTHRIHKFLRERDVKFLYGMPMFGNALGSMTNSKHIVDEICEIYNAFPNERYAAFIEGSHPIMIIRDPELIKSITVKNFDYFVNHKEFFPTDIDIFGMSVFGMQGDKWRDMRTTLSPAFTGSKMRLMLPAMVDVTNNMVAYLREHVGEEIDADDVLRRYSNDVIASAGFGLQVDSFKDKDNEFFKIGQTIFNFTPWQYFIVFLYVHIPAVVKKLRIKLFPESTFQFFRNIVVGTMEYREKNKVERPDMIQLLMEASKGSLEATQTVEADVGFAAVNEVLKPQGHIRKWKLDELVAQVFIFFSAGFETTASTLVLCIHELAINETVQEKLYQEIKAFKETKELEYENLGQLKYLDCVLNETLRRWSNAIVMDRMCTKDYELPPPREGGKPYLLKPGDLVYNMVNAIHLDAKYFPEPLKFTPERFSDENKHNIKPFTFMPFGMGPRNCIGSRLALMEIKVLLFNLLLNFKILKSERTSTNLQLQPNGFLIKLEHGSFVKFEQRI